MIATAPFRLRAFGGLSVDRNGAPAAGLNSQPKALSMLALLAVAGERGVSRDTIFGLLWSASDMEQAQNALSQLLFRLRRELGADAIVGTRELHLNPGVIACDCVEFARAIADSRLETAVEVYQGPFLNGFYIREAADFERWSSDQRRSLEHQFIDALAKLAAAATAASDHAASARWWRRRVEADPLGANAARGYVTSLLAVGDSETARRFANTYTVLIRDELGAEPDADLAALVDGAIEDARSRDGRIQLSTPIAEPARRTAEREVIAPLDVAGILMPARKHWIAGGLVTVVGMVFVGLATVWRLPSPFTTGTTTQLTTDQAVEMEPAISPDGRFVAFAAGRRGEMSVTNAATRIFVKQIAGGRAVPLTTDSSVDQHAPRWSPDGSRIAFQTALGIFVAASHGGTAERLVADSGRALFIGSWSPDGKEIAFADQRGVWTRNIVRGMERQVANTGFRPHSVTWSPDGSLLAFAVGTGGLGNLAPSAIWIVRSSGGEPVRVTGATNLNTSPAFGPDGRSLLYVSNRDGARDIYQQHLRSRGRPWGTPARITTGSNAISISLSADGKRMAYGALTMRSNIWSAPISPGATTPASAATEVTSGDQEIECPSVSPDGQWLIYESNKNGNPDIYLSRVSGGDALQLTNDPADDFCGRISPDGREVAFYSFRDGGRRRVYTMLTDGSRQRPTADTIGQQRSPDWSPDGNRMAFISDRTGRNEIHIISRTSTGTWTEPQRLTNLPGAGQARWSPDGRYVAWGFSTGIMLVPVTTPNQAFWLPDSAGGSAKRIPAHGAPFVTWGPDPSVLYYRHFLPGTGKSEVWSVGVPAGPSRLVLRLDDPTHISRRVEFDTDGKRIFFLVASDQSNTWLVDLKR
jgi:Tol biopolymer transport system component/DNA-binding SARP family transcriptional activator